MPVGLKRGAIIGADTGGNKLVVVQADNSTFALATINSSYCLDLGGLEDSEVTLESSKSERMYEDGEVADSSFTYKRITKGNLLQGDKDLLDFLGSTVKSKTYLEVKYTGYVNAMYQWYFKFVEITPQQSIKRPGNSALTPYESTGIKLSSAVTISASSLASISALLSLSNFPTVAVTISAADSYYIAEV